MSISRVLSSVILALLAATSIGYAQGQPTASSPTEYPEMPKGIEQLGPPEVVVDFSETPSIFAEPNCGAFIMRIEVLRKDNTLRRWRDLDGNVQYGLALFQEDVLLTNKSSGKEAMLRLAYTQIYDGPKQEWTMFGLRSGLYASDGVLPVNHGYIVVKGDSGWVRGKVKKSEGRWAAVTDGDYDHIAFNCGLVSD